MKKLFISSVTAIAALQSALAQGDDKMPFNTMGVELNLGFKRDYYTGYSDNKEYAKGPQVTYSLNPMFRLPVSSRYNVGLGLTYASDKYTQTNVNTNAETEVSAGLFGPSLSIQRYCDPCWSEEDCEKFFTFLGFDFDYLAGDRDYSFTMGSFRQSETGRIRSIFGGFHGGVAYQIAPNLFAQGSVNIAKFQSERTIYDNNNKDNYETNNHFGLFRGAHAGIRYNF